MLIVDFCIILFHFDCTMQLKKSYHVATIVCSRKSATTFGDLPDWWSSDPWILTHSYDIFSNTNLYIPNLHAWFSKSVIFLLIYENLGRKAFHDHLFPEYPFLGYGHSS